MKPLPNYAFRRSIKAKLVTGTAAIVLGVVCLLSFVTARNSAEQLQQESLNQLVQLLNQGVDRLADFFEVREANLDLWVANPLANTVASDPALGSVFVPSLRSYFADFTDKDPWIEDILLLKDDAVVYDDSGTFEFAAGANERLVALPAEGLSVLRLSALNPGVERTVVAIKRQLVEEEVLVPDGFIVLLLDLQTIQNQLFGEVRVGKSGFLSIVADVGESDKLWIPNQDLTQTERADFVAANRAGRLLDAGPAQYRSIILERRTLSATPLAVVGAASLNDARGPVNDLLYTSVLVGILAAVLGIVGAFFFSERLAAPVRELTARARLFADGEYDPSKRLVIRSGDEIGALAAAFNQMAEDISALIEELELRDQLSRAVIGTRDLDTILALTVEGIGKSGNYDRVRLYLHDENHNSLNCRAAVGMGKDQLESLQITLSGAKRGVSQTVFRNKTAYVVEDAASDPNCDPELIERLGVTSYAVVPLLAGDKALGVVAADYAGAERSFPRERLESLAALANTAAPAIENALVYSELEARVGERTRQLQAANARLQELDRLKSDFLSTVSHELRTPLTSVLGFARIIARRFHKSFLPRLDQSEAKMRRDIGRMDEELVIIIEEGERLTRLINTVLDLTKIESGKLEWQMQEVALDEVVQSAVNATASLSEAKGLAVKIVSQGVDFRVHGDQDRLIQVVTNLLSNAIKFTEQGSITCTLARDNDTTTVAVQDSGIGIAADDLDKVFDKFRQVGDTLTDKPTGTGLGLPICKEIIEHHSGAIRVESEPGRGSTFSFILPALKAQQAKLFPRLQRRVAEQLERAEDTPLILVVDDDKSIRTLLRRELEAADYSVLEAGDGHQALQLARTEQPDLIILDILMPGLDGFDVAAVLKQDKMTANMPIIILSIVEDRGKGYQLGVDSYLSKPIDAGQLLATISSLLAGVRRAHAKKILLIEQSADTVRAIEGALESRTYQIITASDVEDGIRMARREQPDLIILDYAFAKTQVDKIVRTLREMTEIRDSHIIVLTEPLRTGATILLDALPSDER